MGKTGFMNMQLNGSGSKKQFFEVKEGQLRHFNVRTRAC
jgi:hypothetical protein